MMNDVDYETQLNSLHDALRIAQIAVLRQGLKCIVVLEGFDASGKGGVIRELSYAWDPRGFSVFPIGPPNAEELAHPFLWRFWQRLPLPGEIAIFDRSWYGRLLVEFVEHDLGEAVYQSSVEEINQFEQTLVANGFYVVKLFLDISQETQKARLKRRADRPDKHWKLTVADLDSLQHWDGYAGAVQRMTQACDVIPWQRIDSNDKKRGRVAALSAVLEMLHAHIVPRTFTLNPGVAERLSELSD